MYFIIPDPQHSVHRNSSSTVIKALKTTAAAGNDVFCLFPMISISQNQDHTPATKPKTPDKIVKRKNSFSSLQQNLSLHQRRVWLLLSVVLLQVFLLLSAPSLPFSPSTAPSQPPAAEIPTTSSHKSCPHGKIFIYDNIPPLLNTEIVKNCHNLNPWTSRCDALSNSGFGKKAAGISRLLPENISRTWYWTDQFSLELMYHNRMRNYRCRTLEPESATAFYIPFYTGLTVEKFLFTKNSTAQERDQHCKMMLDWIGNQTFYKKSNGEDHFITMGRITWDFRRSKDEDWGSSCIYMPKMHSITRLLIERNPWDNFDIGVPYPTGFHPSSAADVRNWQDYVRNRRRQTLFCFAGATRGLFKNDFRGILLNQCYSESKSCRVVDCGGTKCLNGTSEILATFLDSEFCLQPRGDSFTRRSIFDCMVAGSIPVFFWHRTAYMQYQLFLPSEPDSYSVYIDRNEVKNGTSIKDVLENIGKEKVKKMRDKVIESIPKIVYAKPNEGLDEGIRDAFDVAVEGVLKRINGAKRKGINGINKKVGILSYSFL